VSSCDSMVCPLCARLCALDAAPGFLRSWSAWSSDRRALVHHVARAGCAAGGRTIRLWDRTWKTKAGHKSATNTERESNLGDASALNEPIIGFRVEISADGERIRAGLPAAGPGKAMREDAAVETAAKRAFQSRGASQTETP